jgi:hypothetical protein
MEAVMKYSLLRYMSYAVLGFGFLYMTWHLGRAFEGGDGQEVTVTACMETGTGYDCRAVDVEIGELRRAYERVIKESSGPGPGRDNNLLELTKR